MKRLILHIGVAKTGSSALQVAFANNTDLLQKAGINYWKDPDFEKARAGKTTSGNGLDLYQYAYPEAPMFEKTYRPEALRNAFQKYFGGQNKALLSSEMLGNIPPPAWHRIVQHAPGTVRAIAYVRNATDSLWSAYSHISKQHEFCGTFEDFLESPNGYYIPFRALYWANRALGSDQIKVFPYESHKDDLAAPIFATIGVRAQGVIETKKVNTNDEKSEISDEDRALIASRFSRQVAWINETFFDGEPVVAV